MPEGGFFEGVIFEPKDVEVDLVALDQVVVVEGFESFGLLALVAGRITNVHVRSAKVTRHEVIQIHSVAETGRTTRWAKPDRQGANSRKVSCST